jgi:hypothetical protein
MSIKAYRKPRSGHSYFDRTPLGAVSLVAESCNVGLSFATNRDALRRTTFSVDIDPKSFGDLAKAMIRADDSAAINAFADALKELPVQPLNGRHWRPQEAASA